MGGKGSGRKGAPIDYAAIEAARQMKLEKAEKDIVEITDWLKDSRIKMYQRTIKMGALVQAYKLLGRTDEMCATAREIIRLVKLRSKEIAAMKKEKYRMACFNHFRIAHEVLGPYSFHHFLVRMEWDFTPENKFYTNRICVMKDWGRELEKLEFGGYDILGLSGPPRSGKTGVGSLFLAWVMGRHPEKSCVFATHTTGNANKVLLDVLNLITDERRGWKAMFPGFTVEKSIENSWINLTPKPKENNYHTAYFRGIDGGFSGMLEASHLLYVDDLIKNIEEAMNPTRLDTAWQKYSVDISQRRTNSKVKELHIATRWSINDVLTRLEDKNEGNPRTNFIKVAALDENGESNFNFTYNPLDKEHFEQLKSRMDEVSFECIYQQNPIERDGLIFTRDSLNYYEGVLPDGEPDEIVFAGDIAFGGGDFLSMPVGYVYGMDCYVHDVVHSDKTKDVTKPLVVDAVIRNNCTRGFMEANNGGEEYAEDIGKRLKDKNYRCAITSKKAPTNRSKLDRILACVPEIKGQILDGTGYRLFFLSPGARKDKPMYEMYMKHLIGFNQGTKYQGKQKDDAADATASLVTNVLDRRQRSGKVVFLPGKMFGI